MAVSDNSVNSYPSQSVEIWKDIPGYEGIYQASNLGSIKTLSRNYLIGGNPLTIKNVKERLLSQYPNRDGYINIRLTKDGVGKTSYVHKIVATLFCDNSGGFKEINHKDGDKSNNSSNNLEWTTRSKNVKHSFYMGLNRVPKGRFNLPVIVLDTNTGIYYDSILEASIAKNITYSQLKNRLNGITKNNTGLISA